jgi:hypothetical protein
MIVLVFLTRRFAGFFDIVGRRWKIWRLEGKACNKWKIADRKSSVKPL